MYTCCIEFLECVPQFCSLSLDEDVRLKADSQYDARIDSDPILAFPCVTFLHLVVKKLPTFLVINLCVSRINAMQDLVLLCEPAFRVIGQYIHVGCSTDLSEGGCMDTCTKLYARVQG